MASLCCPSHLTITLPITPRHVTVHSSHFLSITPRLMAPLQVDPNKDPLSFRLHPRDFSDDSEEEDDKDQVRSGFMSGDLCRSENGGAITLLTRLGLGDAEDKSRLEESEEHMQLQTAHWYCTLTGHWSCTWPAPWHLPS